MSLHRCRAPNCGRFVTAGADTCPRHADSPTHEPDTPLAPEVTALRTVLDEVLVKIEDTEARAKLIPRIASVTIQAIKTRHHLGSEATSDLLALLESVEREMEKQERPSH